MAELDIVGNPPPREDIYAPIQLQSRRLQLLDEMRGLCILLMVFYHALYLMGTAFRYNTMPLYNRLSYIQPVVAGFFIVMSGICARLSRDNRRRGIQLALAALLVTAVTGLLLPAWGIGNVIILFGVLHLLACCKLLFELMHKLLDRIPVLVGALLNLGLFLFTSPLAKKEFSLLGFFPFPLPDWLYQNTPLLILGFHAPGFPTLDYFPLLPWAFLFFFGTFLGRYAQDEQFPSFCYRPYMVPLGFLGRHSLLVYLLHAPAIYGLFFLLNNYLLR